MQTTWVDKWNERYGQDEFAYGERPNNYFSEQIEDLKPGRILLPAEGKGRNAVFAKQQAYSLRNNLLHFGVVVGYLPARRFSARPNLPKLPAKR